MTLEEQLRSGLHDWADDVDVRGGPDLRADSLAGLARRRALRRTSLVAAALAVALVVVGVPLGLSWLRGPDQVVPAGPSATGSLYDLPTRGSLADDEEFVEAVRRLSWVPALPEPLPAGQTLEDVGLPDPPLQRRHVVFVSDVPGSGRWALVAADPDDLTALLTPPEGPTTGLAWFRGPEGADPDEMSAVEGPEVVPSGRPVTNLDEATGALVVVAAPGDTVELSTGPTIAADGTSSRRFATVADPDGDGIAVTRVDGADVMVTEDGGGSLRFRVVREGVEIDGGGPRTRGWTAAAAVEPPEIDIRYLRGPAVDRPRAAGTDSVERQLLDVVDHPLDENRYVVPWTGTLTSADGYAYDFRLLTATVPSGAVAWAAGVVNESGGTTLAHGCGHGVHPAGIAAEGHVYAVQCIVDGVTGPPALFMLVVVAPPDMVGARALDADGRVLAEQPLDDGVLVTPWVDGTTDVETVRVDGTSERVPVSG